MKKDISELSESKRIEMLRWLLKNIRRIRGFVCFFVVLAFVDVVVSALIKFCDYDFARRYENWFSLHLLVAAFIALPFLGTILGALTAGKALISDRLAREIKRQAEADAKADFYIGEAQNGNAGK